MTTPVRIVLFGMGGYGETYLREILHPTRPGRPPILAGIVDPKPPEGRRREEIEALGVPIHQSGETFFAARSADLAVVASPIHWHERQTCMALRHGCDVLCEKPAAATENEVAAMLRAEENAGRWVAIGFQWSFSSTIQDLKRTIRSGRMGRPRCLASLCLWPRDEGYYHRNDWAGRATDPTGREVHDSPLSNAMAHDLHNLLYLLGETPETSALPGQVTAELYRANPIETFDTVALRVEVAAGCQVLFFASHAVAEPHGPVFRVELERGRIVYPGGDAEIVARLDTGEVLRYPSPARESQMRKLWWAIDAVRSRHRPPCGLLAARSHVACVSAASRSCPDPETFPEQQVRVQRCATGTLRSVVGLAETLGAGYAHARLPGEMEIKWARRGRRVSVDRG